MVPFGGAQGGGCCCRDAGLTHRALMPELGWACVRWAGGTAKPMMKLSGGMPVPHLRAAGWAGLIGTAQGGAGRARRVWDLRQQRACQENAIWLHKTRSSPTPLPPQWLKSFLPRLSQYCHIATPQKEFDGGFKGWRGVMGVQLGHS